MLDQQQIEQLLLPSLTILEKERKVIHKQLENRIFWSDLFFILAILLGVVACIFISPTGEMKEMINFSTIIISVIIVYILYNYRQKIKNESSALRASFEKRVKLEVYQEVFKIWNKSVVYTPDNFVEEQHFEKAGLHDKYTLYTGDDLCEGQLKDGRKFQFSELLAQREEQTFNEMTASYSYHKIPVFKGLFFVLDNTSPFEGFDGQLKIQPPIPQKASNKRKKKKKLPKPKKAAPSKYNDGILDADFASNSFNQAPSKPKEPLPSLFERAYTIDDYGDSSIREKLPLEFTQQLGYFRSFFQQQFSISFQDNKAYFSTRHQFDFWPVALEHSLLSEIRIKHVAWNFKLAFMLLEKVAQITHPNGSTP